MKTTTYTCDSCHESIVIKPESQGLPPKGWRFITVDWLFSLTGIWESRERSKQAHLCSDACAKKFIENILPTFVADARERKDDDRATR